ncbi:MAG: crossover junction endodeoxyribonuclease RuvC [Desulfatiglandaceae bacterium]
MLVLGVDPGSRVTGFGLVEKRERTTTYIHSGIIRSPAKIEFYKRIHRIFESMVDIIHQYHPGEMAIEDQFYAKNVKSALKLGHARAAALIAAAQCGISLFEYTPLEVKKALVGYGRAEKEQVREMVKVILGIREQPPLDASDALAVAICHCNWSRFERIRERSK